MLADEGEHALDVVVGVGPRDWIHRGRLPSADGQLGWQRSDHGYQGFEGFDEVVHVEDIFKFAAGNESRRMVSG
jgi:hypothetical protein